MHSIRTSSLWGSSEAEIYIYCSTNQNSLVSGDTSSTSEEMKKGK